MERYLSFQYYMNKIYSKLFKTTYNTMVSVSLLYRIITINLSTQTLKNWKSSPETNSQFSWTELYRYML